MVKTTLPFFEGWLTSRDYYMRKNSIIDDTILCTPEISYMEVPHLLLKREFSGKRVLYVLHPNRAQDRDVWDIIAKQWGGLRIDPSREAGLPHGFLRISRIDGEALRINEVAIHDLPDEARDIYERG